MLVVDQGGRLRTMPIAKASQALPGLILYRFNHSMYYANADQLTGQVMELRKISPVRGGTSDTRCIGNNPATKYRAARCDQAQAYSRRLPQPA